MRDAVILEILVTTHFADMAIDVRNHCNGSENSVLHERQYSSIKHVQNVGQCLEYGT